MWQALGVRPWSQDDPEIMGIFIKLAGLFPGAAGAGAAMPQ